jgi:uncharacterized protein
VSAYWPFWLGGLFLAAVPVAHWLMLHKMFAVSGRFTAITDRLRGVEPAPALAMPEDALLAALRAETEAAFGAGACGEEPAAASATTGAVITTAPPTSVLGHAIFLVCVALGGARKIAWPSTLGAWLSTGSSPRPSFTELDFQRVFGASLPGQLVALLGGGLLVGFGTRMAGGCTSGHGLCGVSRLQRGSLVATACFFGCGIAVSFLLDALVRG